MAIFNLPLNCQGVVSAPSPHPPPNTHTHFSFHVDTGRVSDKLFFIFYYVRVCLRCVVRRAPPRQGKKLSRDQRETRPGVTQTGRGEGRVGGGGYEVRQERGGRDRREEKRWLSGERREEEGVTEDVRRRVLLVSGLCSPRNIQHVSRTLAAAI